MSGRNYTLTLPPGAITAKEVAGTFIYLGSSTTGSWGPWDPVNSESGGWVAGDTLQITASFNLNPTNLGVGVPLPPASNYHGLAALALYNPTDSELVQAMSKTGPLYAGKGWNKKGFVGAGISTDATEPESGSGIYFYDATSVKANDQLQPPSRGKLSDLVVEWNMKYFADPALTDPPEKSKIVLVFGYGDPMISHEKT